MVSWSSVTFSQTLSGAGFLLLFYKNVMQPFLLGSFLVFFGLGQLEMGGGGVTPLTLSAVFRLLKPFFSDGSESHRTPFSVL